MRAAQLKPNGSDGSCGSSARTGVRLAPAQFLKLRLRLQRVARDDVEGGGSKNSGGLKNCNVSTEMRLRFRQKCWFRVWGVLAFSLPKYSTNAVCVSAAPPQSRLPVALRRCLRLQKAGGQTGTAAARGRCVDAVAVQRIGTTASTQSCAYPQTRAEICAHATRLLQAHPASLM
jgi:hypothetical protein